VEGQQLVLGYSTFSRPGETETHSFPGKDAAGGGQERELQDHRWPWEGERDQPFTDTKLGLSAGIREQLVRNRHREATGCLAGAKEPSATFVVGKKKTTHPPPPQL